MQQYTNPKVKASEQKFMAKHVKDRGRIMSLRLSKGRSGMRRRSMLKLCRNGSWLILNAACRRLQEWADERCCRFSSFVHERRFSLLCCLFSGELWVWWLIIDCCDRSYMHRYSIKRRESALMGSPLYLRKVWQQVSMISDYFITVRQGIAARGSRKLVPPSSRSSRLESPA